MSSCGPIGSADTGAGAMVSGMLSAMEALGSRTAADAMSVASQLGEMDIPPIDLSTVPEPPSIDSGEFSRPSLPDAPSFNIPSNPPPTPPAPQIDISALRDARFNLDAPDEPSLDFPSRPQWSAPEHPGPAPRFRQPDIPVAPDVQIPPVPDLGQINIPEAPDVDFGSLDVEKPDIQLPFSYLYDNTSTQDISDKADTVFSYYVEKDPDSQTMRERWNEMIQGGTGLPIEVEQSLFDRAVIRESQANDQALREAQTEWAARGFSLPGSTLLARELEIKKANRASLGEASREIFINAHNVEVENLRFAVQQGVALEGRRFEQIVQSWNTARQIIATWYEISNNLLRAKISLAQAQLEEYRTDVQVFREKVQVELSKLEVFRGELEAARIEGELRQQDLTIYTTRLQALQSTVDIYRAEMEGVNAQVQAELGSIQAYSASIDAYRSGWEGVKAETDVYAAGIQAETAKVDVFSTQVQAFAQKVNAFRAEVEALGSSANSQVAVADTEARIHQMASDQWVASQRMEIEKIQAAAVAYNARLNAFSAEVEAEVANSRVKESSSRLAAEQYRAIAESNVARARTLGDFSIASAQVRAQSLEASASTYGQLAASALSAVNLGASIGDSVSKSYQNSRSCSETYMFAGEQ